MVNRVVVTGLGVISPIGIGKEAFLKNLKEGKSGIKDESPAVAGLISPSQDDGFSHFHLNIPHPSGLLKKI